MNYKYIIISFICALSAISSNSIFKYIICNKINVKLNTSNFLNVLLNTIQFPIFWLGLIIFVLGNGLWLFILSNSKLSIAYPVQISLVFILSSLSGIIFFNESLKLNSIIGLLITFSGITILVYTKN